MTGLRVRLSELLDVPFDEALAIYHADGVGCSTVKKGGFSLLCFNRDALRHNHGFHRYTYNLAWKTQTCDFCKKTWAIPECLLKDNKKVRSERRWTVFTGL